MKLKKLNIFGWFNTMFAKLTKKQQELQKEIEKTSEKVTELSNKLKSFDDEKKLEKILSLIEKNEYSAKLDNIESSLNGIDLDYLRNLNTKIEKLLKRKKIENVDIISRN